ncbi:MAG: hypothetical protein IID15_00535 [Candidatus Marinimicrobia bacterium]|nr:hypothetical protein [Candidatus Neomarinimicrobiota bacterium]
MKNSKKLYLFLIFLFVLSSNLFAQEGWEIQINQHEFDRDFLMAYASDKNVQEPEKLKKLFLGTSLKELLTYAKENKFSTGLDKTTLRVQGDYARMDINSEGQNMSIVFNRKTGDVTFSRHDRKQKATTNKKKMEEMRNKMMGGMKSPAGMPNINMEEIFKNLPADKRKEAMQAYKKAQESGFTLPGAGMMGAKKSDRKIKETGNKAKINGFASVEYWITEGDKTISLWNTKSLPELTKLYHEIADGFDQMFSMGSKKDDDDLSDEFPDSIPVVKKTLRFNMYGNTNLKIEDMASVIRKNINKEVFVGFSDYKEVPFMNLMMP